MEHTKEPCKHWKLGMIDDWDNCQYCKAIADEKEYDELKQQREELLAALEKICEADSDIGMWSIASETLTKVKEQK